MESDDKWYYAEGGERHGPVTEADLKERISKAQLSPETLVWRKGMQEWLVAHAVFEEANEPPPPPIAETPKAETPNPNEPQTGVPFLEDSPKLAIAYRVAVGLLLVSLFCPWITATSSSEMRYGDAGRDLTTQGYGAYGGNQMRALGNQSASLGVSVTGLSTTLGKATLLSGIAGLIASFIGISLVAKHLPADKDWTKPIMSGIGLLVIIVLLLSWGTADSYVNKDAGFESQYASASVNASVAWGWYIALLSSVAATVFGYLVDWKQIMKPNQTTA